MKIAIYHNLPSGGGLRMLTEIINRYKKNHKIDIYIASENKPSTIPATSIYYKKIRPWSGFIPKNLWIYFILPKVHMHLAREINLKKYDLVFVTHDYYTKSPYLLRYLTGRVVYLCQESQREFYEPWKFFAPYFKDKIINILRLPIKYIDLRNVKYVKNIIVNSKYSKKVIERIYHKECCVVYPGVNETLFSPGKITKKKRILCVGAINRIKDQKFLIQSLRPILNEYELILVGSGRLNEIQEINKISHGLRVKIINNVTDMELRNIYRSSYVTCLVAHSEPFGLSSLESQACGTPVVTIREGGPQETIIDKKTGFLVDRDEHSLLISVLNTIKHHKKLGKEARKNIIKNWTWDKTLITLDSIINI